MIIMNENDLVERDLKRDVWQEALDAVRSIKAGNVGTIHAIDIKPFPVAEARNKTGLSQAKFAELLGVSVRTLQDWEQGRRQPSRAAASLIQIAKKRPDVLNEIFG